MRRLVEPGVPVILGAARPAPQGQVAHAPVLAPGFAGWRAGARHPRDLLRHAGSCVAPDRAIAAVSLAVSHRLMEDSCPERFPMRRT